MSWRGLVAVLALVGAGCTASLQAPAPPQVAVPEPPTASSAPAGAPAGSVTVAQPDPVGTWWQEHPEDLASGDLAALWALPLYRTDPLGRRVPALARAARVVPDTPGWTVEVALADGSWSDGEPVTAADVVATAEALAAVRPAQWGAWTAAEVVDDHTVRLQFDRPYAAWPALLSGAPGVLPAHVLAEGGGVGAYAEELPVTGGWFRLAAREPGVSATFTAMPDSPLGSARLAEVEVLVVPGHDTALGLVETGVVDLVLGHIAIDPEARRSDVAGVVGSAVFGGTRFELEWAAEGDADAEVRAAAARLLDPRPFTEGLLRDVGRMPGGLVPALERLAAPTASAADGAVSVQYVRTVEGLGLLARRLQSDLANAGVESSLVRLDPPQHLAPPIDVDGRLRVVRVDPDRSLAALLDGVGLDPATGVAADAAGLGPVDPAARGVVPSGEVAEVAQLLADDPRLLPVAEVAVTHVWHPDRIAGITPSGWPGIGFWNAGEWSVPSG